DRSPRPPHRRPPPAVQRCRERRPPHGVRRSPRLPDGPRGDARMIDPNIPEVLPVLPEVMPVVRPRAQEPRRPRTEPPLREYPLWVWTRTILGWIWRWLAGAWLCFNAFLFSYLTSIVVVGWTYRWMQGLVLRGWWQQSKRRTGSFEDFCAGLGRDVPTARPRWFWQERIAAAMARPVPGRGKPGPVGLGVRALRVPWHSLWRNFKVGFQGLFCTYLLTGWGCLLMLVSWEFGWLNSFNKGYEQAWIGPTTGFLGVLLLIAALF